MDLVQTRGFCPHFEFQEFHRAEQRAPDRVWDCEEDLRAAAASCGYGEILGTISGETAKKWLCWPYGDLYAVGWNGVPVYCLDGGVVWVGRAGE